MFHGSAFADDPISIPMVNPERTLLEKIFLLQEEFQRSIEKRRVNRMSRHLYDIFQLSNEGFLRKALADLGLYQTIINHRKRYTKVADVDYSLHLPPHISFIPKEEVSGDWENDYKIMQQEMIYGESPAYPKLIEALIEFQTQINQTRWNT